MLCGSNLWSFSISDGPSAATARVAQTSVVPRIAMASRRIVIGSPSSVAGRLPGLPIAEMANLIGSVKLSGKHWNHSKEPTAPARMRFRRVRLPPSRRLPDPWAYPPPPALQPKDCGGQQRRRKGARPPRGAVKTGDGRRGCPACRVRQRGPIEFDPFAVQGLCGRHAAEAPVPARERIDRGSEVVLAEVRPKRLGEVELRVGALPEQEVGQPLLAAGADRADRRRAYRCRRRSGG